MKGIKLTKEIYAKAKKMLDGGMNCQFVADILKIGYSTTKRIKQSNDFDDYKRLGAESYKTNTKVKINAYTDSLHEQLANVETDTSLDGLLKLSMKIHDVITGFIFYLTELEMIKNGK